MNNAWLMLVLFVIAIAVIVISQARAASVSKRQKTVNIAIIVMCIGGIGSTLPTVLGVSAPEVRSTALVFSVCCTLVGLFFVLRHRNA